MDLFCGSLLNALHGAFFSTPRSFFSREKSRILIAFFTKLNSFALFKQCLLSSSPLKNRHVTKMYCAALFRVTEYVLFFVCNELLPPVKKKLSHVLFGTGLGHEFVNSPLECFKTALGSFFLFFSWGTVGSHETGLGRGTHKFWSCCCCCEMMAHEDPTTMQPLITRTKICQISSKLEKTTVFLWFLVSFF